MKTTDEIFADFEAACAKRDKEVARIIWRDVTIISIVAILLSPAMYIAWRWMWRLALGITECT